jgi:hypothetical protein
MSATLALDHTDPEGTGINKNYRIWSKNIYGEALAADYANENKLNRWLNYLADTAKDIFDLTVAALTGPQAALAPVARKLATKVKQSRAK